MTLDLQETAKRDREFGFVVVILTINRADSLIFSSEDLDEDERPITSTFKFAFLISFIRRYR